MACGKVHKWGDGSSICTCRGLFISIIFAASLWAEAHSYEQRQINLTFRPAIWITLNRQSLVYKALLGSEGIYPLARLVGELLFSIHPQIAHAPTEIHCACSTRGQAHRNRGLYP